MQKQHNLSKNQQIILDLIVKSFGATFGTNLSARQGIVQDLNRNTMLGTLSHIRRLSFPLPAGSKSLGPRKLHNSQWGFVCPIDSPDGGQDFSKGEVIVCVESVKTAADIYQMVDGEVLEINEEL